MENGGTERKTGGMTRLFTDRLADRTRYWERDSWLFHFPQALAAAKHCYFGRSPWKFKVTNSLARKERMPFTPHRKPRREGSTRRSSSNMVQKAQYRTEHSDFQGGPRVVGEIVFDGLSKARQQFLRSTRNLT